MSALGHYSHRATARVVDFNDYLTAGAIQRSSVSRRQPVSSCTNSSKTAA
jgi:hypothetical protein